MAGPSISNIAVHVTGNTAQLTSAMNKGAASVQQFANQTTRSQKQIASGIGGVSTIAQQGVFAVDDFFAAFATGGVAGGLRGATNNLTMIAASLGGIKVQLLAIAALTVGQFLAKQFDGAFKQTEKLKDETDELTDAIRRRLDVQDRISGLGGDGSSLRKKGGPTADDVTASSSRLAELREAMGQANASVLRTQGELTDRLRAPAVTSLVTGATREKTESERLAIRMLRDRLKVQKDNLEVATEEFRRQEQLAGAIRHASEEAQRKSATTALSMALALGAAGLTGGTGDLSRFKALGDVNAEIARIRESMLPSFSVAEMFSRMPGAHSMGSIGAVGAINSAMAGQQNMRDGGASVQRDMLRQLQRIRELEEEKARLEVVAF